MASIPTDFRDLFEKKTFGHLATLLPDGYPHVTAVWVDYDPEENHILVNTERERQKEVNARNDERVGISMTDPDNSYRNLSVTGEVAEIAAERAEEHIDAMARRYMDVDEYPSQAQTERVIIAIEPHEVNTYEG